MVFIWAQLVLVCLLCASGLPRLRAEAAPNRKHAAGVPIGSVYNLSEWLSRPLQLGNMVGMFITSEKNAPLLEVAERMLYASQFKSAASSLAVGALTDDAARFLFKQLPDVYAGPKSRLLQSALDAVEAELQRSLEDAVQVELDAGRLAVISMHDWMAKALHHFRPLDVAISVLRALANALPRPDGVGAACFDDSMRLASGLFGARAWALNMIDAWGKPVSGILTGNLKWAGAKDQCEQVTVPPEEDREMGRDARLTTSEFTGSYCEIHFEIPSSLALMLQSPGAAGLLQYGACMPSTCSGEDVRNILKSVSIFGMKLPNISMSRCESDAKTGKRLLDDEQGYCSRSATSDDASTIC